MPVPADFRTLPPSVLSIAACGRYTAKRPYWRLYVIENVVRIIIHSILEPQLGAMWLSLSIGPKAQRALQDRKVEYIAQPHHSYPGPHDIYFLFLSDLSRIMLQQSQYFLRRMPDVHNWVARLESIRLPRNVVGHMNWLNTNDLDEIDRLYADIKRLELRLSRSGVALVIPS